MELPELIAAVKAAKTKNDLAELVSKELSLDLNKNKTMSALRAEVLNGLGVTEDAGEDEPEVLIDPAAEGGDQSVTATAEVLDDGDVTVTSPLVVPAAEDPELKPEAEQASENRLLRNTDGRTFIWTPVLAKLPGMEEV